MTSFRDTLLKLSSKAEVPKEKKKSKDELIEEFKQNKFRELANKHMYKIIDDMKRTAKLGKMNCYITLKTGTEDFMTSFSKPLDMFNLWLKEMSDPLSEYLVTDIDEVKLVLTDIKTSAFVNKNDGLSVQFIWGEKDADEPTEAEKIQKFKDDNFAEITAKHHAMIISRIAYAKKKGSNKSYINFVDDDLEDFENSVVPAKRMLRFWLHDMSDLKSKFVPCDEDGAKMDFKTLELTYDIWNNAKNTVLFTW